MTCGLMMPAFDVKDLASFLRMSGAILETSRILAQEPEDADSVHGHLDVV